MRIFMDYIVLGKHCHLEERSTGQDILNPFLFYSLPYAHQAASFLGNKHGCPEGEEEIITNGASSKKRKLAMVSVDHPMFLWKNLESYREMVARFICSEKKTIGVADGVGGWCKTYAGESARHFMSIAETAVVFVEGSSTACILTIDQDNGLTTVNMGDGGFMLIRNGGDVYKSSIQQYSFNYPYQLQDHDRVEPLVAHSVSVQVMTPPVEVGEVIGAGTDGLFDSLHPRQLEELVKTD
ncbi:unnamed protein product [Dovyalis caffra]|uniref:Protein phosphatase n=1 Tax=Dovyalis caffra TaxID=77055 RepID=A0AAV1RKK9_9ROSI|nr:unnamed protein product [Dovyalis caffra]